MADCRSLRRLVEFDPSPGGKRFLGRADPKFVKRILPLPATSRLPPAGSRPGRSVERTEVRVLRLLFSVAEEILGRSTEQNLDRQLVVLVFVRRLLPRE